MLVELLDLAWRRLGRFRSRPLRSRLTAGLLLAGLVFYAYVFNHYYPLRHWLFFRYARAWLFALVFSGSSLVAGWRILPWLLPRMSRLRERLVFAWGLGVVVFYAGVFLAGIAGWYGDFFFWLWPLLLLLFGCDRAITDVRRLWRHGKRFGVRLILPRGPIEVATAVFLVLSLAVVYLQVMLPKNVSFDAVWYHLSMAERYTVMGGIRRFDEGWFLGAYPQLATVLYTWAFLAPGNLFDHVLACSHLEFCLFLATLLGIAVLAERMLGHIRLPFAGAAIFLFPGIFVYDCNLNTGADHILAFWAPLSMLSLLRLERDFTARAAIVSGLMVGGAVCTKYQACYIFVPAAFWIGVLVVCRKRWRPAFAWGGALALVTASHWLKNWVFYHDPLYPLLHRYLPSTPFFADAEALMFNTYWAADYLPVGATFWQKLRHGLTMAVTFPFMHQDGQTTFYGKDWPFFGALFTLLTPVFPLIRAPRRLWAVAASAYTGILIWYFINRQERYLQALVPLLVAVTVAALVLVARSGRLAYAAAMGLVGLQLVWGADAPFVSHHAMLHSSALTAAAEHFGAALDGHYEERYLLAEDKSSIAKRLPRGATVLLRNGHIRLGLGVPVVSDNTGLQGAIDYLGLATPHATRALWANLGVTHVLFLPSRNWLNDAELARELVFRRTTDLYTNRAETVEGWRVARLEAEPRDDELADMPTRIAWLRCDGGRSPGIYATERSKDLQLEERLDLETVARAPLAELAPANAVVVQGGCQGMGNLSSEIQREFVRDGRVDQLDLWLRVRRHPSRSTPARPNLAFHRPVEVSSQYPGEGTDPRLLVDGDPTNLGFHTQCTGNQFVVVDLGSQRRFDQVVVYNRADGYQERAVPLTLEVSSDKLNYRTLAEKREVFSVWKASGIAGEGRYVRLRNTPPNCFHLAEVEIR